jgi:hypothetical protein
MAGSDVVYERGAFGLRATAVLPSSPKEEERECRPGDNERFSGDEHFKSESNPAIRTGATDPSRF